MSRYIDAEALKIPSEEMVARMVINSAPSIDLVRCKECRWYRVYADKHGCRERCDRTMLKVNIDGFCSYGERREP